MTVPGRSATDGPLGAVAGSTPDDAGLHRVMAFVPYLLLGLSFLGTLAIGGEATAERLPWVIAATSVALCFRVWWQLRCAGPRARIIGFVFNLGLTLALISLSSLYGLYAFVGYLDAVVVFSGTSQAWALVAAGSLNALAQTGGPSGALQRPWLFAFLLVANGGLAVVMVRVDRHRQLTVTRLQNALAELESAKRVNEELQAQLLDQARDSGVLEERQRLSREIHDTVAQGLIGLLRQIEAASAATSLTGAREILEQADQTARDSLTEARRAVGALASPLLDGADLPTALSTLTAGWSKLTGTDAFFSTEGAGFRTPHDGDLVRVCQEALSNVARHSGATRVDVRLNYTPTTLCLGISDDGCGFDPQQGRTGHGLNGIHQRIANIGGTLDIDTTEGGGCTMSVVVPR